MEEKDEAGYIILFIVLFIIVCLIARLHGIDPTPMP